MTLPRINSFTNWGQLEEVWLGDCYPAHSLPFRTRTFWDGGLHCITLDIRRNDDMIDLFPERGVQELFVY